MFNPKSDYALNKMDPEAIVYIDSRGTLIRLTVENFASPEEFQRWKEWSDSDYRGTDIADALFSKRILSLHGLSETAVTSQSPEDMLVKAQELRELQELRCLLTEGLDTCLTATQRRRLWLSCVCGLTVRQIARLEGTTHQGIVKSIKAAKKNIGKFFADRVAKTPF